MPCSVGGEMVVFHSLVEIFTHEIQVILFTYVITCPLTYGVPTIMPVSDA